MKKVEEARRNLLREVHELQRDDDMLAAALAEATDIKDLRRILLRILDATIEETPAMPTSRKVSVLSRTG